MLSKISQPAFFVFLFTAVVLVFTGSGRGAQSEPAVPPPPSCGSNALYLLLEIVDHPASIDAIEDALPTLPPHGYTMNDIAHASRALGYPLRGLVIRDSNMPLASPAIAFLQQGDEGHFVVLRPCGNTGTMVQVIDPPKVPKLMDYSRLFASKYWTGKVLVRDHSSRTRKWIGIALLLVALIYLGACIYGRFYRRQRERRESHV